MTAAQRATLEELAEDLERTVQAVSSRDGDATARQHARADALRAALGTCGTCEHADMEDAPHEPGWCFCAAPGASAQSRVVYPFNGRGMPLGERCTGYTPKEGA